MNHSDWSKKDLEYIWHPCSQMKDYETLPPIVVDHGKGVNLYDVDGKRYLDVVSSWWCNLLGHSHPKINRAIKEQLDSLEHVIFANFSHRPAITLCEELMKKIPRGLCKFNFSDNGSASIESAMKMSFQYHYQTGNRQKVRFMSLSDAYHGETLGALSAGGLDLYSELYKPLLLDIVRIPAPDCYRCPKGNKRGCCQAECIDAAPGGLRAPWGRMRRPAGGTPAPRLRRHADVSSRLSGETAFPVRRLQRAPHCG